MPLLRLLLALLLVIPGLRAQPVPPALEGALARAGDNGDALRQALEAVPAARREGMMHLLAGMPDRDARRLPAAFLVENVTLAYEVRERVPWGRQIPDAVFRDAVLPYAHVSEARDPWRRRLMELCLPLVAGCRTPGEAAQRLNRELFPKLGVRYSTKRRRADQSPKETIETGLASCTGLSILLASACRSVAVPARLAGTASWVGKPGNHTWVEVWDGRWWFTGAAEPDPGGLDRGWFVADAARARADDPRHAIWAATWTPTPERFPLAWAADVRDVYGVNVTARYARSVRSDRARLMVEVKDAAEGRRVAVAVEVHDLSGAAAPLTGTSRDERADTNDLLTFDVPRRGAWRVVARDGARRVAREVRLDGGAQETVRLRLPADPVVEALRAWFADPPEDRGRRRVPPALARRLRDDPEGLRRLAGEAWRASPHHDPLREDARKRIVRTRDREAPYTLKRVGRQPQGGWPLFIAMHGGGGVPERVNDAQWRHMQRYYRDQPDLGGYLYCALRAPNDAWDGFYDAAISPLVVRLIRQLAVTEALDLDRTCLMGYSHGGYGAFVIGPRIPDRFAAVHASAAAPTDGRTRAENLRNLRFSFMVGEKDTAYGRLDRCRAFDRRLAALRGDSEGAWPTRFELIAGNGHTGLPDRDKIRELYAAVRDPMPRTLSWRPTDDRVRDHYWLHLPHPATGQELEASVAGNRVRIRSVGVDRLSLRLDRRLVDPDRPLLIDLGDRIEVRRVRPAVRTFLETLERRGDPGLAATILIELEPAP